MKTPVKISAFALALAAAFGGAYGVGSAVDPVAEHTATAAHSGHGDHGDHGDHGGETEPAGTHDGHGDHAADAAASPGGLRVSEGGYTLDLKTPVVPAGRTSELRFAIDGADGRALTAYKTMHDKDLHLIVASRDLGTFRHVHPVLGADGTWTTSVDLPRAGAYRVFADFTPGVADGTNLILGADLGVTGTYEPQPLPAAATTAEVDGYRVTLDGALRAGTAGEVTLSVSKDGKPVTDLQPYLGAYGHLVALRADDLAYLHVHPAGEPGDGTTRPGPAITFMATAPSAGAYRLFLDFRHGDSVHTAAFTVTAAA